MPLWELENLNNNFDIVRTLFIEYKNTVAEDGSCECFGGFDKELAHLPGDYATPKGVIFLVLENKESTDDKDAIGCVAVQPKKNQKSNNETHSAEIKRLYVRPSKRASGLGKKLIKEVIKFAKQAEYESLFLETVPSMGAAIKLYEKIGFVSVNEDYKADDSVIEYYQYSLAETKRLA